MSTKVKIYDTTLRDGMGTRGLSLSVDEKIRIAQIIDQLGISYIEAGFPNSNPKELELFKRLETVQLLNAEIAAFGMTRRRDQRAENDPALMVLADCFAPVVTLVGKSWDLHLEKVIRTSQAENLEMITDSISFCKTAGKRVFYDAEHFFDGYLDNAEYALQCLNAAVEAGAENVTLCDTNGGTMPEEISEAISKAISEVGDGVSIGIHTHNDSGCAVANSLLAVSAGADLVQGTFNGYGERCGNADLTTIIPALQLKMKHQILNTEQLQKLTEAAHLIDEICNHTQNPSQPYVGRNAFAHKAGMHASGVARDQRAFEHIQPEVVGNTQEILASELAGSAAITDQLNQAGLTAETAQKQQLLQLLKDKEHQGYHYEAAPASFELLLRQQTGEYEPLFELESFKVLIEKRANGAVETEATIKLKVDGQRHLQVAEGNGPVNALDKALRSAITTYYPHLADIELTNYKVRILDEDHGTSAVTRVLLDSSDGESEWGTIGVSENIIEASWQALVDSLEYAFQSDSQTA